jgi:cold shock CspA family protein
MTGRVANVHPRGFCFIKRDDNEGDIYAHCSNFEDRAAFEQLTGGERVEFAVAAERRIPGKLSALDVVVIG